MSSGSLTPRRNRSKDSFDEDDMEGRPLVAEERGDAAPEIPMCGCMSIKYYQPVRLAPSVWMIQTLVLTVYVYMHCSFSTSTRQMSWPA